MPPVTVTHSFPRAFGMTPGCPKKQLWTTEERLQRKVPNSGSWHVDIARHRHAGDSFSGSFTRMNRELNFGWTSLPNFGVFRDSSREPVSPVGTYRSASRPDENLNRWSMPRWAVSTKLMFSGVFPLFVYWELYGTMILHELGFPFKQPLFSLEIFQ